MSKTVTLTVYVTTEDDTHEEAVLDEVTEALNDAGIIAYIETIYEE